MIRRDIIYFDLAGCETSVTAPSRCSAPFPLFLLLCHVGLVLVMAFSSMLKAQNHPVAENQKSEKGTVQILSPQEQSLTIAGRKFMRVDEYYDSTTRVWSVIFVDDPQHPESYANQLILNFYDSTPKPTSEAVATAITEERSGMKNIFLFKAPDEPGGEIVYHIVSVTHTQTQANFVNIMRVADWENAAVNINFSHRLGVGVDLNQTELEARQWLMSPEGGDLRDAASALRVGGGWHEHLKHVK